MTFVFQKIFSLSSPVGTKAQMPESITCPKMLSVFFVVFNSKK